MIFDSSAKTVRIPVRFRNGRPELLYGGPLPSIEENAVGELVLYAFSIRSAFVRDHLATEDRKTLLDTGSDLLVFVRHDGRDQRVQRRNLQNTPGTVNPGWLSLVLKEPLVLRFRGTKSAALDPCACSIPGLDLTCSSLNEAYTRISEAFEPTRRSHTGNVFRKVFARNGTVGDELGWSPLEELRSRAIFDFEAGLGVELYELMNNGERPADA